MQQILARPRRLLGRDRGFIAVIIFTLSHFGTFAAESRLPRDAYVWQRVWSDAVCEWVLQHGSSFSNLLVLSDLLKRNKALPNRTRLKDPVLDRTPPLRLL